MADKIAQNTPQYDVAVIGGGPAGATAALELARKGWRVALLNRPGRIKPCGGAIPPRAIRDFDIPEAQIVARATTARMVSPKGRRVDMPIEGGSVGMVDRDRFDAWLRTRAGAAGARLIDGTYRSMTRDAGGSPILHYSPHGAGAGAGTEEIRARLVIGADGANSRVGAQEVEAAQDKDLVFAYHEIITSPEGEPSEAFEPDRCEIHYDGTLSPDFYAWVFPHGGTTSVGVGSAQKGFSLKGAVADLRNRASLDGCGTVRTEGAPIPLKPLKRWDNGKDVMLAGDAAGCVAPASGEGIYYALLGGAYAADAMDEVLRTGDVTAMSRARKRYMREHGKVFWILGIMQHFWYRSDKRRERFVNMCDDKDVQRLTWDAYMNKRLVRANPMAHVRIFLKDMAHLMGLAPVQR